MYHISYVNVYFKRLLVKKTRKIIWTILLKSRKVLNIKKKCNFVFFTAVQVTFRKKLEIKFLPKDKKDCQKCISLINKHTGYIKTVVLTICLSAATK